jgi:hypothetical protein
VQWHIESLHIKCHKGHHVSHHRCRGCEVLRHVTGDEFPCYHNSLVHEALQMSMRDLGRGPILFRHRSRGKEKQRSLNPQNLPFLSPSLFLGSRKEARRQQLIVREDVRLSKGGHLLL